MCKFYRIASNSLQAIQIVHELFDCPSYVTNIIGEPKYKYGQQERVTVRNHNRSTAFERSVLKYLGGGA